MADIKILSKHLVNKIAAGEVIERPASVVKELVENSLDAGASAIDIAVADGGKRLISVRDNGVGMGPEDLKRAFLPHATSKIADEEDLFNIHTMGFRGEALASIAAVSHAHIVSRRCAAAGGESDSAHEVRCDGGEVGPVRPAAGAEGATVTVGDLFFNTPGRRKFMRTTNTEFGHVVEQLARLALPHRRVAFTLTHNGRCTHRLPAAEGLRQRAGDLLGAELAQAMISFSDENPQLKLAGLIAPPAHARTSTRWQYFFVNGRYVRDRLLSHAVREACRGLVDSSHLPVALLLLEIDPQLLDVNVHPTKIEVRFHNGQTIHSHLLAAIREAFNRADLAPSVQIGPPGGDLSAGADADEQPDDARRQSLRQALGDFLRSQPAPQRRLDFPRPGSPPSQAATLAPAAAIVGHGPAAASVPSPGQSVQAQGPPRHAIQIHNSYIVSQTDDGLVIIDQHALHERIIFDQLKARTQAGRLAAQRLLIPATVRVTASEKACLDERAEMLGRLGVEFTEFGPQAIAVQKFPALLAERKVSPVELVRELLDLLADHAHDTAEHLLEQVLATMACKAAVKAGQGLSAEEIDALLAARVGGLADASCPHGRPTTLALTIGELEKQFKRT